jgi:hypothetical protein
MAALGNQKPGQKIEPRIGRLAVIPSTLWQLGDGIGQEFFTFFMALGRLLAPYVFGVVAIAGSFIQAGQLFRGGFGTLRCKLGFQFHRIGVGPSADICDDAGHGGKRNPCRAHRPFQGRCRQSTCRPVGQRFGAAVFIATFWLLVPKFSRSLLGQSEPPDRGRSGQ